MSNNKVFSLAGQNLKLDSKADIQSHLDTLAAIDDLEEIHLGGNTLGVEACQALAEVLKTKKTLKVADFADIFTGRLITEIPDALRALCDALQDNENLVELNLSDNAFGGRSAEPMVNFLKHNHHFSVLKLNNNGLGVTGGTIVAEALIAAAEELKAKGLESKLRTVICGRNRLENGSAPIWAKAFAAHGGLVEVRMFQNGIRMEGIEAISQGLAGCPNLEVLDLQDNTATLRGSRAIAACLPKWPKLKTLNLSDCLLKPKGGALVFAALEKGDNKQLETIQVQYCDLDRKALATLGSAIDKHLSSLTKLEINGNWADEDDECITKIKDALAKHDHAEALDELDEMDPEGEDDEDEGEEEETEDKEDEPAPNPKEAVAAGAGVAAGGAAAVGAGAGLAAADAGATPTEAAKAPAAAVETSETDKLAESLEQTKVADEVPATAVAPATIVPAAEPLDAAAAAPAQKSEPVADGEKVAAPAIAAAETTAPAAAAAAPAEAAPKSTTAAAAPAPAAEEVLAPAPTSTSEAAPPAVPEKNDAAATTPAAAAAAPAAAASGSGPAASTTAAPETPKKEKKKSGGLKGLIATLKQKLA